MDLNNKFIYNPTIYNLSILDNYVNKFLDIKLREFDFFKKKETNPIWGFQFEDGGSINIFSKISREICKSNSVVLIAYEIDNIDLKYAVSVKKHLLKYAYNYTKNSKPKFKTVEPLYKVPINKNLKLLLDTTRNVFLTHPYEFDKSYIALPRLRTRNIIKIQPAIIFDKYADKFNTKLNEEEFINLLNNLD